MGTTFELRNKIREIVEKADEHLLNIINDAIIAENEELQDWQKQKIEKGIEDIHSGQFSTSEEVRKKALECIK